MYNKLQHNIKTRPVMNASTASTDYGSSLGSRSGSISRSSSGSSTGYNSGFKTSTGSNSGSIGPGIYGEVTVPTITIKNKETLIQQLQEQLGESNKAQFTMIGGNQQQGKNVMQNMKQYVLESQDECNIGRVSQVICQILWPYNKILPQKWMTFREHPQSMCQLTMTKLAIPDGVAQQEYWESLIQDATNNKFCNLRA
jgi:hypothetical protein